MTGRAVMIGYLTQTDPESLVHFNGLGHAPAPIEPQDTPDDIKDDVLDMPSWMVPHFEAALGDSWPQNEAALRDRAPVMLRVNLRKTRPNKVLAQLEQEGVTAQPCKIAPAALRVEAGAHRVAGSNTYRDGLVELQDGSSQAAMDMLRLSDGMAVLDFCAGGGGKSLAMAMRADLAVFAHDADPARMKDLPERAARAGVQISITKTPQEHAPYDLVLADVPCSGAGTWRRHPEAKWTLTPEKLLDFTKRQALILQNAVDLVSEGGTLAYTTCSFFRLENSDIVQAFLKTRSEFHLIQEKQFDLSQEGDGFYVALMQRDKNS